MPETRIRRLWVARLILLALSVGIAVIGLDVMVRLTGKDSPLVWHPDPVLGWWHIPESSTHWTSEGDGWVHINSLGIRDPERVRDKPAGAFRIAVFGDSMTEGVQVNLDQTFTQLLEQRLSSALGRRVEVWNFGVNGYGPLQEYLLFKAQFAEVKPDLVIQAVFLDNDVADLHPALASGQSGAPFATVSDIGDLKIDYSLANDSFRSYNSQPIAFVRRTSALYRAVSDARWRRVDTTNAAKGVPRRFLLYAEQPPPEWDEAWRTLDGVVATFASDAKRGGIPYVLLSVPAGQIVNSGEIWKELEAQYPAMSSVTWNLSGPEERFRDIAARHDIPLIEPFGRFAADPARRELFFGRAGHFTPAGHQVMATILAQELAARSLIPVTH